ncbi:MAG: hypothetical protein ABIG44_13295 [Planctomycetota bacterium]
MCKIFWSPRESQGFWLTPAVLGTLLIVIGILIYVEPRLLAYFVGGIFMLAGVVLLSIAWRMRRRVTYRRIDEARPHKDDRDNP